MTHSALPEPVASAVIKAFGLNRLSAGVNSFGQDSLTTYIDSIWIIELPQFFFADTYIAGVNQIKWTPTHDAVRNVYKGLLLAAPSHTFDFYGADPYRIIDLEWPDEMAKGLQSLNMLPYYASPTQFDGTSIDYAVHTYWSDDGEGHASYRHITSQRPEIVAFHNTILHTIKNMATIYNDSEINQIIERGLNLRRSWRF